MPAYHVQRSIFIDADKETVFQKVVDYSTWTTWSPWLCAEPDAQVTVTENSSSVGSVYSWKGEVVGQGEIEHKRLEPGRLIEDEIRFVKPFKSRSDVSFDLETSGDGTRVTWHMKGSLPWFLFWMTGQMEIFIGMDYERGLKMLKEWIETGTILSDTKTHGVEPVGPLKMAGLRRQCSAKEIAESMQEAYDQVKAVWCQHDLPTGGDGISVYHHFDMKAMTFDYTCGFLIPETLAEVPSELTTWSINRCNALRVEHVGSYDNVGNGWSAAHQYARYKKLKQSKAGTFELYKNDPDETPSAELRTEIFLPLK